MTGPGRTIHWPQPMLQRAALAVRETRSNDVIVIALAALKNAIRTEQDIRDLLGDRPKPAFRPKATV